jgi:Cdc6-like AAA superfamily ATPase
VPRVAKNVPRVAKNVPRVAKNLEATVGDLYIGHLAALHAIISLSKDSTDPITSSQAYPAYVEACKDIGIEPVKRDPGFGKLVEALANKELIHAKVKGRTTEITPIIDQVGVALVVNRFATIKAQAQAPPPILSDGEIAELLHDAPAQQLALIAIHRLIHNTGKNQVLQSDVYSIYAELCRKKGGTPKKQISFANVIADLARSGYITVYRWRSTGKPENAIRVNPQSQPDSPPIPA